MIEYFIDREEAFALLNFFKCLFYFSIIFFNSALRFKNLLKAILKTDFQHLSVHLKILDILVKKHNYRVTMFD